jgi:hypothetical protein
LKQIFILVFALMIVTSLAACRSNSLKQEQNFAVPSTSGQAETNTNKIEKTDSPNTEAEKKEKTQKDLASKNILKVSVFQSGEIQANGIIVNLTSLEELIKNNATYGGIIWYYRESGHEEPSPQAKEVIELVIKYRRPISLSSKSDFSDYIDPQGNSVPRLR